MTEVTVLGDGPTPPKLPEPSTRTWRIRDRIGLGMAWFIGLLFCAILAAIVVFLAVQGIRYLHLNMLWTNPKSGNNQQETGGILAPLLGSLILTVLAMAIATPVGVAIAVWLSEYARPRALARVVESTVEMLAGTPSIVLALFGLILFESKILAFLSTTHGGIVYGKSFLGGALMLALLGLPLVVANTREGLQAIPTHVREASYALGKTKIATIRRVLLPASRPAIVSGAMIGAGHVLGDTTIIVFVVGDTLNLNPANGFLGLFRGTGDSLTSFVYDNAPTGTLNQPQKAYAAAFILLLIVLVVNIIVAFASRNNRDRTWT